MLPLLMALSFSIVAVHAYWANQDLFSPTKLYLLTLCVCFLDIFLTPYRIEIHCIYLGLLFVPLVLLVYEKRSAGRFHRLVQSQENPSTPIHSGRVVQLIWLLTIPPVLSTIYLVTLLGGLKSCLDKLAIRALALQGLNIFSEPAIDLISILTVLYFGVGLIEKRRFRWWLGYAVHFLIAVAILLLSGSRRDFLMPLLITLAMSHYLKAEVSIRRACGILAVLLVITSVYGVIRMGRRGADGLTRELDIYERESLTYHFKYGLLPLEIMFDSGVIDLHYGSTFVTTITNFVPRLLWPEKPDSAGLVITKEYLGDPWHGTVYISAGLLAESIMNFGFPIGLCFSFAVLVGAMLFLLRRYHRALLLLQSSNKSLNGLFELIRYLVIALAITGLVTWETAIVVPPLIMNLSALWVIERLLKSRFFRVRRPMEAPLYLPHEHLALR